MSMKRFEGGKVGTIYPEDHGTNEWLRILANEQAKTNRLLESLIKLYLEDNPRPAPPEHVKSGAL